MSWNSLRKSTCQSVSSEAGIARPDGAAVKPCRVFLLHEAPYLDQLGQVTSYKTRAEVALIEAGRLQVDLDQLEVGGVLYNVVDYADQSDDGIVRGLWLDRAV